jgi:hypothetical protein
VYAKEGWGGGGGVKFGYVKHNLINE